MSNETPSKHSTDDDVVAAAAGSLVEPVEVGERVEAAESAEALAPCLDERDIVDELPDDLNAEDFESDYTLPNNNRRRIPAAIYGAMALGCLALWVAFADSSPYVNDGMLWVAVALGAFAIYGFVAGRTLNVDETEALITATRTVGFAVGHASAQMVWRGWLSRPVWRLLVYSSENPPKKRGIVIVDAVEGGVVEWFAEDNPEDWAQPGASGI
ncbi:MAG: hypothetical protein KDB20_02070 [Microthrixaceae bacterium]|nr:hypothetical protein [Microthrixaceae bacterium]